MVKLKNELVKGNRSLAEQLIIDRLKFYFKKLIILPNDKTAIKKELDIYLPALKVAIECDGPCHTFPIYGEETLAKTQERDSKKDILCEQAGIKLIRIKLPLDSRVYPQFIKDELNKSVIPAIKQWILDNNL